MVRIFYKLTDKNAIHYPDSLVVSRNASGDSVYKTLDSLWQNKESDDAGQLFLASLDKLTKNGNKLCVSQLLASQHLLNDKNEFTDKIDRAQYKRKQYKSF